MIFTKKLFSFHVRAACFALFLFTQNVASSDQGEVIGQWADKFGKELYDLGEIITKSSEIKSRYSHLNAQVEKKEPKNILAEIVENISRMMDRKMDAIRCIISKAEEAAEAYEYDSNDTDYQYYSSKYTSFNKNVVKLPEALQANGRMYLPMNIDNDTHFYNIPVNTSHSSVHVPVNIYDRHKEAQSAIQWSKALENVFIQNYNSDPALSWQYFGSSSGIMRHYPAMQWKEPKSKVDEFDCRIRTWFIEAATCTKDVIILIDSSGSMQGMRKHVASFTVFSILDTFSNNDYINVMNYSTSVNYTVPCFKDMLVQATKENIASFTKAIQAIEPNDKSDVSVAFAEAFQLLEQYREKRGCTNNSECNQAIMLVTDGIARNLTDVFDKYNRINNGSNIPVRIFTYLIGREVTKVNEIMWAACTNRGYYAHVQSLEEVKSSVFKYISVVARPLVLQGVDHPVSWTHAYHDITYDDENDKVFNEPYRLLTSVAVPAFDRKINNNNDTVTAALLGVAGTDVPIDDIAKLTTPYKIGVMAYAFIVSNNGYVLMHPGLRPVFNKTILKENYNSVDISEIEQHDHHLGPRQINPLVLELREALVNGIEKSIPDAKLKYHYDDMRRISRQLYDYYIAPLPGTPFSIGLAMPDTYGNFTIKVGLVIERIKHEGLKLTHFFQGANWKIHPKWVYCKYHYLEGHEFETPEIELTHFLKKIQTLNGTKFKWHRQYEAMKIQPDSTEEDEEDEIEKEDNQEVECDRKTLNDNDYYCDRDLIQRLIFDAKNTYEAFKNPWVFNTDQSTFERYNVTLRFVATMSGLTRWEYIFGEEANDNKTEFGDLHSRAIDETWYKSAVLQHQYDTDSYVYSVPSDSGADENNLVTSSYAIFPKDAGLEAPGSVVGYQFSHAQMEKRFFEITRKSPSGTSNAEPCGDLLDCYVVDSSGYIIISHDHNDTGRFFGEIEGAIMQSMLKVNIFDKITIYDFQALCRNESNILSSDSRNLQSPVEIIKGMINYVLANILWALLKTNLYQVWDPNFVVGEEFVHMMLRRELNENDENAEEEEEEDDDDEDEKDKYYPCDLQRDLFILNQNKFIKENGWSGEVPKVCSRSFYVKRIKHSNLILVAVNISTSECDITYTTAPTDVEYDVGIEHPCQKLVLTNLTRRRLAGCYNEHPLEQEIRTCGKSSKIDSIILPTILIIILNLFIQ